MSINAIEELLSKLAINTPDYEYHLLSTEEPFSAEILKEEQDFGAVVSFPDGKKSFSELSAIHVKKFEKWLERYVDIYTADERYKNNEKFEKEIKKVVKGEYRIKGNEDGLSEHFVLRESSQRTFLFSLQVQHIQLFTKVFSFKELPIPFQRQFLNSILPLLPKRS